MGKLRYDNVKVISNSNKKMVYDSNLLPYIKPEDTDILIITSAEDRLDLLAQHYYKDATLWWIIALANNLTDIDLKLEPGTQLRIPTNVNLILNSL